MDKKVFSKASGIILKYLLDHSTSWEGDYYNREVGREKMLRNASILNFVTDDMTPRFAKGVVGLEYYKIKHKTIDDHSMKLTLAHDVFGMIRKEPMLIPRSDSYVEFYEEEIKRLPSKYPFNEGDDYWTIMDGEVVWSCWDDVSEDWHDENPYKLYFKSEKDAVNYLRKEVANG